MLACAGCTVQRTLVSLTDTLVAHCPLVRWNQRPRKNQILESVMESHHSNALAHCGNCCFTVAVCALVVRCSHTTLAHLPAHSHKRNFGFRDARAHAERLKSTAPRAAHRMYKKNETKHW